MISFGTFTWNLGEGYRILYATNARESVTLVLIVLQMK